MYCYHGMAVTELPLKSGNSLKRSIQLREIRQEPSYIYIVNNYFRYFDMSFQEKINLLLNVKQKGNIIVESINQSVNMLSTRISCLVNCANTATREEFLREY